MKNLIIPDGYELCPECDGKREVAYSCCTGEIINNDIMMCPKCHEHLGDEPCYTCDGLGYVAIEAILDLPNETEQ